MDEKKVTVVSFSTLNFIKSQKRLSASAYKYSYKTLEYTWLWLLFKPKFLLKILDYYFVVVEQVIGYGNHSSYCDS